MQEALETTVKQVFTNGCHPGRSDAAGRAITGERINAIECLRRRNTRFAKAQKLIVAEIKNTARTKRQLNASIKEARRNRERQAIQLLTRELSFECFKEVLFRKLADSIAWQLIDGRSDVARHLYILERSRPAIDETNLASVEEVVDKLNTNNPASFALISDLTTFIQIGDILRRDLNRLAIVEVKEGEENIKAIEILDQISIQAGDGPDLQALTNDYGDHLARQVNRIYKQKVRADRAMQIINMGEGIDPVFNLPARIREPEREPRSYNQELAALLVRLDNDMWAYTVIEGALLIGCYNGLMKRAGYSIIEMLAQQTFKENFLVIAFRQGLKTDLAEPIFLKPFREKDIMDIVFDRTRIYAAISINSILEMFRKDGLEARWLSRKETAKVRARSPRLRLLTLHDRGISISNKDYELHPTDALIARIIFDCLLPSSVVAMFAGLLICEDLSG